MKGGYDHHILTIVKRIEKEDHNHRITYQKDIHVRAFQVGLEDQVGGDKCIACTTLSSAIGTAKDVKIGLIGISEKSVDVMSLVIPKEEIGNLES